LVFNQSALSTNTVDFDKNELTIVEVLDDKVEFSTNTNQRITSVLIYDLQGRLVYNLKGNSSKETYNLSNLNSQIYIAKVGFANGETVSKKALKK